MEAKRILFVLTALVVVVVAVLVIGGCDEAGAGSDDDADPGDATIEDGDSWRLVGLGINDDDTWFMGIDSTIDGDQIDITFTASSDQDPEEGSTGTIDYTEDDENVITLSSAFGDSVGRLNRLGTTFMFRGSDLTTDDEGQLFVAVRNGSGLSDATFSGDYWIAFVWSDTSYDPVYFTGTYDATADGAGGGTTANVVCDQAIGSTWDDENFTYAVASNGLYSVTGSDAVVGIVREDGEFMTAVETYGTPEEPDNTEKRLYFGVQKSTGAAGSLLEGTWEVCSSCAGDDSWYEAGGEEMTLDATGSGTYTDFQGTEYPVSVDLESDGTFTFEFNSEGWSSNGAITPSGDTAVIVYPERHPTDDNYCVAVAIKEP